ncbi:glycosyltransferase family 4 protein [Marinobacter sp. SS21]|uniref:glycosyltransferase family 4 protein n=1 Tax=Marinobacter sp. SS21 TaxID=2979460 RepID=UPI00232B25E0|nr:glycosyltransferase family 4 protein [Marinobacter sp. SS21]MDC0661946.1 glycosyltransferase family 4 protein [Marinobacter sp. SS21]
MRIALVWDADYPWDVRVEKVASSLIKEGHDVHLICRNTDQRIRYEEIAGIKVNRLPVVVRRLRWLNSILTFPAFFNPIWLYFIWRIASQNKVEHIIVRDLPLCPAGIWVAKWLKVPCSMDMAECYPEMLRCIWKFEKFRFQNILVRNPYLADLVEMYCLKRLSKIFAMIEESRDRLIRKGVPAERVSIVSNTPSLALADSYKKARVPQEVFQIVYLGILNPSRGLDTVIEGMSVLQKQGVGCKLVVAGTGKAEADLRSLVQRHGVSESVEFLGWVTRDKVKDLFASASIGVVPHHVCGHWNSTIPNKLFDYMAAGVPVVSTNVGPMERIITHNDCGRIYTDNDPESFARTIVELGDRNLRERLGENGRQAVLKTFNWENDELKLTLAFSPT